MVINENIVFAKAVKCVIEDTLALLEHAWSEDELVGRIDRLIEKARLLKKAVKKNELSVTLDMMSGRAKFGAE